MSKRIEDYAMIGARNGMCVPGGCSAIPEALNRLAAINTALGRCGR